MFFKSIGLVLQKYLSNTYVFPLFSKLLYFVSFDHFSMIFNLLQPSSVSKKNFLISYWWAWKVVHIDGRSLWSSRIVMRVFKNFLEIAALLFSNDNVDCSRLWRVDCAQKSFSLLPRVLLSGRFFVGTYNLNQKNFKIMLKIESCYVNCEI